MEFSTSSGQRSGAGPLTLKASGAQTSSATGASVDSGFDGGSLYVEVDVTVKSGTSPTLLVEVDGSVDGTNWVVLGTVGSDGFSAGNGTSPTAISTVSTARGVFPAMRFVRYKSTIAGTTPSFTYSVTGSAA